MKKLIIMYPEAFNCFEKFQRKVARIIVNLSEYSVSYIADHNGFIQRFFNEKKTAILLSKIPSLDAQNITHAIVFDDGEEFPLETKMFQEQDTKLRIISINITRVINIKREPEYSMEKSTPTYEYIGRGSYWGNPYSMFEEGESREEVIRKYKYDFDYEKFINIDKSEVYKLAGKRLGCFCKPHCCHGDVLANYLNAWDDGK